MVDKPRQFTNWRSLQGKGDGLLEVVVLCQVASQGNRKDGRRSLPQKKLDPPGLGEEVTGTLGAGA